MCGILGYFTKDRILKNQTIEMRDTMTNRGPDDSGVFISKDKKIALASRRLSIIDLSQKGHQPMSNTDKSIFIVHNGEVYNFQELRNNLKEFSFRSNTDTEVILRLYEKYGIRCVDYLDGMFAFIIYDEKKKEIFFARDHLGIKPLYYYQNNGTFIIASEIKALLKSPEIKREISPEGFLSYLYFGSIAEPYTIIKNIKMFPPASFGILKDGKLKIERYWKINSNKNLNNKILLNEELLRLLKNSIRKRLISDVPLGAFLSGGVDSSSVVSLMREVGNNEVKTFSLTFGDSKLSEGSFSRIIADKYETNHTERVVTPTEVREEIDEVIEVMDQPTVNGVNTYFVSKYAKESGLTVSLSGLGGDELFGGYSSFWIIPRLIRISNNPFLRALAKISSRFLSGRDRSEKLNSFFKMDATLSSAYFTVSSVFNARYLENLLKTDFYDSVKKEYSPIAYIQSLQNLEEIDGENIADVISLFELRGYMRNQLLRDTDFMSMAHSLEIRVPLIDKELVEFAFSLPSKYRKRKKFLVETMGKRLPKEVWNRPKQGFTFPFDRWIRTELNDWVKESLFSQDSEYFKKNDVKNLWESFLAGNIHWSKVWTVAVFNRWKNLKS
jgi:asparagine synthase (glutamine-hydrolysing)